MTKKPNQTLCSYAHSDYYTFINIANSMTRKKDVEIITITHSNGIYTIFWLE